MVSTLWCSRGACVGHKNAIAMLAVAYATGRASHAKQVMTQTKRDTLVLQAGGLVWGWQPHTVQTTCSKTQQSESSGRKRRKIGSNGHWLLRPRLTQGWILSFQFLMKVNLLRKTQQSSQSRLRPDCIHSFQLPLESCIRHFNHTLHFITCVCFTKENNWSGLLYSLFYVKTKTPYQLGKQNHKDLNRVTSKYCTNLAWDTLLGYMAKLAELGVTPPSPSRLQSANPTVHSITLNGFHPHFTRNGIAYNMQNQFWTCFFHSARW
jgi:hypothetical protein